MYTFLEVRGTDTTWFESIITTVRYLPEYLALHTLPIIFIRYLFPVRRAEINYDLPGKKKGMVQNRHSSVKAGISPLGYWQKVNQSPPKLSLITLSPPLNRGILGLRMGPYVPTPRFFTFSGDPGRVIYQNLAMRKYALAFSCWTWDSNSRPTTHGLSTTPFVKGISPLGISPLGYW